MSLERFTGIGRLSVRNMGKGYWGLWICKRNLNLKASEDTLMKKDLPNILKRMGEYFMD